MKVKIGYWYIWDFSGTTYISMFQETTKDYPGNEYKGTYNEYLAACETVKALNG